MERFICIHGHFYQPPRENPWLEAIEIQDSAFPYHDWNERIMAECYAPNAASRNLDQHGRIVGIVSNYARISFNFGPTLLSWMEQNSPEVYQAILEADRQSMVWRSGHGAALAQVYNHIIMPLASERDKRTQVQWGIRDFVHRFSRFPEGIWLAETAVDTETLEILAEAGIGFTVLAPHQAAAVRRIGGSRWTDVSGSRIDPSRAYRCMLPSGRSIALFFYDGPISQAVAFEKLLDSGEHFAGRLMSGFSSSRRWSQLVHIATDGETYGHHHPFGDMALGHALSHIEHNGLARLTNYGEFLALHPPTHEVRIVENSSWSCLHGIERWRNDCGCNSGGHPGWNQSWRRPLRESLDRLAGQLAQCFQDTGSRYLHDPWQARDDYITVMLDRSDTAVDGFLQRHALRPLQEEETEVVLCLLEMQRHALLMYTSCGWFFDELSGIETVQILQYAARAMQLARRYCTPQLEQSFLQHLAQAESNISEFGNGAELFEKRVSPSMVNLVKVGAHYAVSSIFDACTDQATIFSYRADLEDFQTLTSGQQTLNVGRVLIRSAITRENDRISFCTMHFGSHSVNGGVRSFIGDDAYQAMKQEITGAFEQGEFAEVIRGMDRHFGMHTYSLKDLFRDHQRQILKRIISQTMQEFEEKLGTLYQNSRSLMGFLRDTGMPVPTRFTTTAQISLNLVLQQLFDMPVIDFTRVAAALAELADWELHLDQTALELVVRRRVEEEISFLDRHPDDHERCAQLLRLLQMLDTLPFSVNLWQAQNVCWQMLQRVRLSPVDQSGCPGADGQQALTELASLLNFAPEMLQYLNGEVP